jgi:hypothetical protein
VTPNSDWWDRAKLPPRPQPIEIRKRETICTLHRGEHQITLEKRTVPTMGEELILSVNAEWRRMRVFRLMGQTSQRGCSGDDDKTSGPWLARVTIEPPTRVQ